MSDQPWNLIDLPGEDDGDIVIPEMSQDDNPLLDWLEQLLDKTTGLFGAEVEAVFLTMTKKFLSPAADMLLDINSKIAILNSHLLKTGITRTYSFELSTWAYTILTQLPPEIQDVELMISKLKIMKFLAACTHGVILELPIACRLFGINIDPSRWFPIKVGAYEEEHGKIFLGALILDIVIFGVILYLTIKLCGIIGVNNATQIALLATRALVKNQSPEEVISEAYETTRDSILDKIYEEVLTIPKKGASTDDITEFLRPVTKIINEFSTDVPDLTPLVNKLIVQVSDSFENLEKRMHNALSTQNFPYDDWQSILSMLKVMKRKLSIL